MNRPDKKQLFKKADSWASDREDRIGRSNRTAWTIAWIAVAIAVLLAFALVALLPLKTVVPYTILVDRQTGYVTTLDPSQPLGLTSSEALSRSMLVQYVSAREGFNYATVREDYRKVASWSSGVARSSYEAEMRPNNPDGPFARYSRNDVVTVVPKSVSPLSEGSALVRFDLIRTGESGATVPPIPYAAVIRYRFQPREMSVEERFINPLGFEVLRYRVDPEAIREPAIPAQAVSERPARSQSETSAATVPDVSEA